MRLISVPTLQLVLVALTSSCSTACSQSSADVREDSSALRGQGARLDSGEEEDDVPAMGGFGGAILGYSIDCAAHPPTAAGTCTPTDASSSCQACVARRCCDEQTACNSLQPMNSCAFGSTLFHGSAVEGGEIACVMECLAERSASGRSTSAPRDVEDCTGQCASSECRAPAVSAVTRALAECIVGDAEGNDAGCREECGFLP